jgi:hypothetical protein
MLLFAIFLTVKPKQHTDKIKSETLSIFYSNIITRRVVTTESGF